MSPGHRRTSRRALVAVLFLALAAWFLPSLVSVERYRRRLEAGLEQALNRPVDFSAVSLRLLPRPGFVIENVVVHEDPRFGIEPFARVDRIDCDLAWRSLFGSRFIFSRLHLDHPTFNVVRNAAGEWNAESLLRESGIALPAGRASTSRSARTKSLSPSRTFAPNSASSRRAVCCAIAWSEGRFAPI